MSLDMYYFIKNNEHRLKYDLENGLVITPRGTNGTVCSSTGYLKVKVNKKTLQVHQILAVKYFDKECVGKQINHKDGNKLNNSIDNLELCTQAENIRHGFKNGLYENTLKVFDEYRSKRKGELVNGSKLTEDDVRFIRNSNDSHVALAKKFDVNEKTIRDIRKFKTWKHVT